MLLLIQLFTRIPINKSLPCSKNDFRKALWFLPILGGLIGAIQGLVFYFANILFPISISILLAMLVEYFITGGLHIDGLADTADALFSGKKKEKAYAIMKDSSIGAFGAMALIINFLLQHEGLQIIASLQTFIIIGIVAKTSMLCLAYKGKSYGAGIGETITNNVTISTVIFAIVLMNLSLSNNAGIVWAKALMLTLLLMLFTFIYRRISASIIGGLNGDQYGFIHEVSKIIVILILLM
ncbi:MAG: adenosylcobinamide-GDP ribazoletransferase [Alkaliphilus sp.]